MIRKNRLRRSESPDSQDPKRTSTNSPKAIRRAITLLISLAISGSAAAEVAWDLRAYGAWLSSDEGGTRRTGAIAVSGDVGDGTGAGLGAHLWLTPRFGLGLDIATGSLDLAVSIDIPTLPIGTAEGDIETTSLTASLPFALHRSDQHSLYLAPLLSWVSFDDVALVFPSLGDRVTYQIADETGAGLRLGYDRALGTSNWAFHAHAEYTALGVDGVNPENPVDELELDPDPYSLAIGLAWRN